MPESDEEVVVPRDEKLEQRLLAAVIADRNDQPRNKQLQVGPSSIGFCRELLRAMLFEQQDQNVAQEDSWAAAAHVGSVMGEDLERIFGERLDAVTQQRITTLFEQFGVSISGAMDLAFVQEGYIGDLKSTTDIGGVLYDLKRNGQAIDTLMALRADGTLFDHLVETPSGSYELTDSVIAKISKLQYYCQIAIYVVGARQAGVLEPDGEGRLIFYDRAGDYQGFVALVVSAAEIDLFFDIAQHRIEQVMKAQQLLEETGNPFLIRELRDQPPSFCFSSKVMCPLRHRCWGGSEWDPVESIDSPEIISAVDRYAEGRRLAKLGDGMKRAAREELKGISGVTPEGRMVSWTNGRINVVDAAKRETAEVEGPPPAQGEE